VAKKEAVLEPEQTVAVAEIETVEVLSVYPEIIVTFWLRIKEAEEMYAMMAEGIERDILRMQIMQAEEKKRMRVPYNAQFHQNRCEIPKQFIPEMMKQQGWGTQFVTIAELSKWFNGTHMGEKGQVRGILAELKRRAENVETTNAATIDLDILSKLGAEGSKATKQIQALIDQFADKGMDEKELIHFLEEKAKEMSQK
jgi:hypothetical protein